MDLKIMSQNEKTLIHICRQIIEIQTQMFDVMEMSSEISNRKFEYKFCSLALKLNLLYFRVLVHYHDFKIDND